MRALSFLEQKMQAISSETIDVNEHYLFNLYFIIHYSTARLFIVIKRIYSSAHFVVFLFFSKTALKVQITPTSSSMTY